MERLPLTGMTYDEYLALDDASEEPLEYVNGEIVAVGGASRRHNRVVGNVWGVLNQLLKGRPCVALAGSQRDDTIEILKLGASMRVGDLYDRVDEVD